MRGKGVVMGLKSSGLIGSGTTVLQLNSNILFLKFERMSRSFSWKSKEIWEMPSLILKIKFCFKCQPYSSFTDCLPQDIWFIILRWRMWRKLWGCTFCSSIKEISLFKQLTIKTPRTKIYDQFIHETVPLFTSLLEIIFEDAKKPGGKRLQI